MNDATQSAVSGGLNMIVAAGNDNQNACNYSPASASSAVTVGATDINDSRASYSNYGKCLDIFGPGSSIKSAWIGSPNATNTISGTSMATPQVCGVAAKYLSANPSLTTSQVTSKLISDATKDIVKNEDGGTNPSSPDNQSPDLMVYGYCTWIFLISFFTVVNEYNCTGEIVFQCRSDLTWNIILFFTVSYPIIESRLYCSNFTNKIRC